MIILNANEVRQSLPMPETIEAMKIAFSAFSRGQVEVPIRSRLTIPPHNGTTLIMPAFVLGDNQALSIKVVSVFPGATSTDIWGDAEVDHSIMMTSEDVAHAMVSVCQTSDSAHIEELVLRPQGGDL